ncbi:MAG TPA: hypothetical protein VKX28_20700 [Xanthobacteraceae bacterium]|nr:hypothetical protein [Xanthobacteraceae bacterium]
MMAANMSAPTESTVLAVRSVERTIMGASCFLQRGDRCFIAFVAYRRRPGRDHDALDRAALGGPHHRCKWVVRAGAPFPAIGLGAGDMLAFFLGKVALHQAKHIQAPSPQYEKHL